MILPSTSHLLHGHMDRLRIFRWRDRYDRLLVTLACVSVGLQAVASVTLASVGALDVLTRAARTPGALQALIHVL